MVALSFLSVTGLFILFDAFACDTGWEIKLGIPILLAAYLTVFVLIFSVRKTKQKGLLSLIQWLLRGCFVFIPKLNAHCEDDQANPLEIPDYIVDIF